jgi:hypothetical protein
MSVMLRIALSSATLSSVSQIRLLLAGHLNAPHGINQEIQLLSMVHERVDPDCPASWEKICKANGAGITSK